MSVWGNPVALGGSGGSANIQALSVTQNGTYTASGGVDGYSPVTVAVPGGGGGSTNVLSGASVPSAAQGSNRAMYLKYVDVGSFPSGITPQKSIITAGGNKNNGFRADFPLSSTVQIVMWCNVHRTAYANWHGLIAERSTTPVFGFYTRINGSDVFGVEYGNVLSGPPVVSTTGIYDKDIEITIDGSGASWTDGTNTYSVTPAMVLPTGASMYFFGTDFPPAVSSEQPKCTVYRLLVKDNDTVIHDYRPAKDSNSVICLYDMVEEECVYPNNGVWTSGGDLVDGSIIDTYAKVNGVWQALIGTDINDIDLGGGAADCWWRIRYYNQSGGRLMHTEMVQNGEDAAWGAGRDWSLTPNGTASGGVLDDVSGNLDLYKVSNITYLTYIEASLGQFINTGYVTKVNSRYEMDTVLNAPSNSYDTPFGARNGGDVFVAYNGGTLRYVWKGSNQNVGSISAYCGQRGMLTLENGKCAFSVNGTDVLSKTFTAQSAGNSNPMFLFTLGTGSGSSRMSSCDASLRLYGFRIYEGETLVREYLPALDGSSVPCLYEEQTDEFYYNLGSGTFSYA